MIIAIDFDGVLCENMFPRIGAPNYEIIMLTKQLIDEGYEVILWTSRTDQELKNAVNWCEEYGLNFAAVNENAPSNIAKYKDKYPNGTRKVYADIYIDDHSLDCQMYARCYSDEMVIKHIADAMKEMLKWKKEN